MATADETKTNQNPVETAANVVVDDGAQLGVRRYFTIPGRDPFDEIEWESRVAFIPGKDKPVFVQTIGTWGRDGGYFANEEEAAAFENELKFILVHQLASFNSPVWFNVGFESKPQCSA